MRDTVLEAMYKSVDDLCLILNSQNANSDKIKSLTAIVGFFLFNIAEKQAEIQTQAEMLQLQTDTVKAAVDSDGHLKLKEEWKLLEARKMQLEEERRKFTDAAIKMGLERANLQRERADLEEKRRTTINSVPSTPKYIYS